MIVADTSAWIDYFRGVVAPHTDALDRALSESRIIIGDLILAELLQGFSSEREFQIAKQLMEGLEYRDFVGRVMAMAAAQNSRALRMTSFFPGFARDDGRGSHDHVSFEQRIVAKMQRGSPACQAERELR